MGLGNKRMSKRKSSVRSVAADGTAVSEKRMSRKLSTPSPSSANIVSGVSSKRTSRVSSSGASSMVEEEFSEEDEEDEEEEEEEEEESEEEYYEESEEEEDDDFDEDEEEDESDDGDAMAAKVSRKRSSVGKKIKNDELPLP